MFNKTIFVFFVIFLLSSCGSTPELTPEESWNVKEDEIRKSKMSAEELTWEKLLEKQLKGDELTIHKNKKLRDEESPYDFAEENPKLPRVLLIGDAQSLAYTLKVRDKLSGTANVIRIPENGLYSAYGAERIQYWLNTTTNNKKWDLIHFQFSTEKTDLSLYAYAQNLRQIVRVLKRTHAKLLWSNVTPTKPREVSIELNKVSARTMKAHKIPIVDVYSAELPFINDDQKIGVAINDDGLETISRQIANAIKNELNRK